MATWSPSEAGLQEILQTIRESTDNNPQVQRDITVKLNNFTRAPEYIAYLAYILGTLQQEQERIRTIAGYLLKNNARLILRSPVEVGVYVRAAVLQAFSDPSLMIRNAASQAIVSFLGILEPKNWPECLQHLFNLLESPNVEQQEAAFNVLEKACEDYPRKLDVEINGAYPLEIMIPKFLTLSEHPSSKMRAHAIACLSYFVPINCQSLFTHIDTFITCLFKRASDEDPSVRRHVCQALVLLLASRPDKLMPEMANVAEYMLYSTKDRNDNVALEACEFWLTFAEDPELAPHLHPLLPKVAPVLLDCMLYSEDDLLWLDAEGEDSAVPDKETDIKPRHYSGKAHGLEHEGAGDASGEKRVGAYGEEVVDEEEEDYDDDEDFAEEMSTEWNLRKCAAAALDVLAVRFGPDLLTVLLEPLKAKLWNEDWLSRESGILALGAMAEGCIDAVEPHLPQLIPYLLTTLNDAKPLVRSIACWTLGRYAGWCTQATSEDHKQRFFVPTLEGLLRMVLDNNKRVQEAGCSAFATFEEDAGQELVPYLEPVLRNLVFAFEKYQHKNMLILYDAVGTLADAVGSALQTPAYVEILMPSLIHRWSKLKDDDDDLIPLLECLASVTIAMGPSFLPHSGPVFDRCYSLIHKSLVQYQAFMQNSDTLDEPDRSFLVVALDLLSGLTQGLGMSLEPYISRTQPSIMECLTWCLRYPHAPVRQSAYALVGDLAMNCFPLLRPYMAGIMHELIEQLDPEPKMEFISACNNAAWSVGEVALRYGRDDPEFQQWVNPLISRLIPILLHPKAPRSLHENAAVSIGRIGLMHPAIVAPLLPEFAQAWCQALYEIRDNEEKDSAFRGLCTLVQANPAGMAKSLLWFCNAIVRWTQPSPELNDMFARILHGFKQQDAAGWAKEVAGFPPVILQQLQQKYGV